jgi:hypothetical protein
MRHESQGCEHFHLQAHCTCAFNAAPATRQQAVQLPPLQLVLSLPALPEAPLTSLPFLLLLRLLLLLLQQGAVPPA